MRVYFIPQQVSSLESPDLVRKLALNFKFKNPPDILAPTVYRFLEDKGGEIIIDLTTQNFSLSRPIPNDIPPDARLDTADHLKEQFQNYLTSKVLFKDGLQ